jgi:hypothetical protein
MPVSEEFIKMEALTVLPALRDLNRHKALDGAHRFLSPRHLLEVGAVPPLRKAAAVRCVGELTWGRGNRAALVIGTRQHDGVIQRAWALQRHIHTQQFAETCQEELNLVCLRDGGDAAGQRHEFLGKLVDGAFVTQERQFTNWALREQWTKPFVDQLDEAWPRWQTIVELQLVVPQLGVIGEVKRRVRDAPLFRGAPHTEIPFTLI